MATDTLSSESAEVERIDNIAGRPSAVLKWDIPDSEEWVIEEGEAVVMEVQTDGGNDPSRQTEFALGIAEPQAELGVPTLINELPVAPFNALTISQQQSGDNAERRTLNFNVDVSKVVVESGDTLELWVDSPDGLDHNKLYFEYTGIRKRSV